MELLKELRLRRWARENYVSPALRDPLWNAVVLDEMRLRDEEVASREIAAAGDRIVPLVPVSYFLDGPHPGPPSPHLFSKPARESAEEGASGWGLYIG